MNWSFWVGIVCVVGFVWWLNRFKFFGGDD